MGNVLNTILYEPIYNLLIIFYDLFGENLGLAIIAIAVLARILMIPLTARQIKMAEMNKEFAEKMKEVKKKHKNNKEKQQQELMKLQSQYLPAQLGGCLPMIFQFIFFIYIYNVIRNIINEGIGGFRDIAYSFAPNFPAGYEIHSSFFGILDLGNSASKVGFKTLDSLPYIVIILLVGVSQYYSMKVLSALREKRAPKIEKPEKKKDKDKPEDFGEIMQQSTKQAMLLMPFLIMFISFSLPSGVGIYWITQSTFVILQQFIFDKLNIYQPKSKELDLENKKDDKKLVK